MTTTPEMVESVARAVYGKRPDFYEVWEHTTTSEPGKELVRKEESWEDAHPGSRDDCRDIARAAIAAHESALAAAGLVIVPREPTEAMQLAGHRAHTGSRGAGRGFYFDTAKIYRAMNAAALEPQDATTASPIRAAPGGGREE